MDIKEAGTITLPNGEHRIAAIVITRFGTMELETIGYWTGGTFGAGRWVALTAEPVVPANRAIAETFVPNSML